MKQANDNNAELREEILDTIKTCREYLEDAEANAGRNLGPFAHVFAPDAIAFAKAQIAFEEARLAEL